MDKFEGSVIGLRDMVTEEIIAVYPHNAKGSNEDIRKTVKDWYYAQDCENEERLKTLYVDILTKEEIASRKL